MLLEHKNNDDDYTSSSHIGSKISVVIPKKSRNIF